MKKDVAMDLVDAIRGRVLAKGAARTVYEYRPDTGRVLKRELYKGWFQNVTEWTVWERVDREDRKLARWLAPCYWISDCGLWLVQARVVPFPYPHKFPVKKVPALLRDVKVNNFGLYEGRIVCCDYGVLPELGSSRLVKAPE